MAAKPLYIAGNPAPNIDVYTPQVVVFEGETFDWTLSGQDGQPTVTVENVPGKTWPFTASSFAVARGNGTPATVPSGTAGVYQFQCVPAAPTSPQTLIVALVYNQCGSPSGLAGSWFAYENTQNGAIVVKCVSGNLPLAGNPAHIVVPANQTVLFQIATNAAVNDYPVSVTFQQGGSSCCSQAGEPKIVVSGTVGK
ncbi:MAG TPA: hypothetical protein VFT65_04930 [Candidatus Angelobacter sp.]|nr:hypothetical protein [Candidatus Angelobacter sp.]